MKPPCRSKLPRRSCSNWVAPPEITLSDSAPQMPQNSFLSDWIVALSPANHLGLQTRLDGQYISPPG